MMEQTTSWCNTSDMTDWSDSEIVDFYDRNPNLINREYARQLDMSAADLNEILMDRG